MPRYKGLVYSLKCVLTAIVEHTPFLNAFNVNLFVLDEIMNAVHKLDNSFYFDQCIKKKFS